MKIGICTGGGDCPGLNAAIRAVVRHGILNYQYEMYGIKSSLNGLLCDPPAVRRLQLEDVAGILDLGGTILGTSNKGSPFKDPIKGPEAVAKVHSNWQALGLDCLIVIGGDGTQRMAMSLHDAGMPIVGIPKTIDNDFVATDVSIGFMTAVEVASDAISRLHSTAEAHSRVMVAEVMGRDAGFIALHAGIAAGANVILIPEIPFDYDSVLAAMKARQSRHRYHSVVVVAEGARPIGGESIVRSSATGSVHLGGIADEVARQIYLRGGFDARVTVLGHIQRGGVPVTVDRILATVFGVRALELAAQKQFGRVVGYRGGKMTDISFDDYSEGTRSLNLNDPFIHAAEAIGICLGRTTNLAQTIT